METTVASSPHSAASPYHEQKHFNTPKRQEEIRVALSEDDVAHDSETVGEILSPFDYGQIADDDARAFMQIVWRLMDEHAGKYREELFPYFEAEIAVGENEEDMKSEVEYAPDVALREEGGEHA